MTRANDFFFKRVTGQNSHADNIAAGIVDVPKLIEKLKGDKDMNDSNNWTAKCGECGGVMRYSNLRYGCEDCGHVMEV